MGLFKCIDFRQLLFWRGFLFQSLDCAVFRNHSVGMLTLEMLPYRLRRRKLSDTTPEIWMNQLLLLLSLSGHARSLSFFHIFVWAALPSPLNLQQSEGASGWGHNSDWTLTRGRGVMPISASWLTVACWQSLQKESQNGNPAIHKGILGYARRTKLSDILPLTDKYRCIPSGNRVEHILDVVDIGDIEVSDCVKVDWMWKN